MEGYSLMGFSNDLMMFRYLDLNQCEDLRSYQGKTLLDQMKSISSQPLLTKITMLKQILNQTPKEYPELTSLNVNFYLDDKRNVCRMPDYFFQAQEAYRQDAIDYHYAVKGSASRYETYFQCPEKIQNQGQSEHLEKALVYNCFMIAHYFFCKPDNKKSYFELLKRTVETPYQAPKEIRKYPGVCDLFRRALEKDPNKRISLNQAISMLDEEIKRIKEFSSSVPSLQGIALSKVADLCENRPEAIQSLNLSSTLKEKLLVLT